MKINIQELSNEELKELQQLIPREFNKRTKEKKKEYIKILNDLLEEMHKENIEIEYCDCDGYINTVEEFYLNSSDDITMS